MEYVAVECIQLDQDRAQGWEFVNTTLNPRA
jgi:hypothetical protein